LRTESSCKKLVEGRILPCKVVEDKIALKKNCRVRGWKEWVWGNMQWDLLEEGFPRGVTVHSETEL